MNALRAGVWLAAIALLCCAASPSPNAIVSPSSPSPGFTAPVDKDVLARAKSWYSMLQAGSIDRSQLTKLTNDALTPEKVSAIAANLKLLGNPSSFTQIDIATVAPYTVYHYRVGFTGGLLVMTFGLDASGKIAGLSLQPERTTP